MINFKGEDFAGVIREETGGQGVDLVFDMVGRDTVARSLDIFKPFGRIAAIVSIEGDINKAYGKNVTRDAVMMIRRRVIWIAFAT
jgi:NADPH:quinone reductase